jgi:formylglycine-generating enzyme required for sulfatase activity
VKAVLVRLLAVVAVAGGIGRAGAQALPAPAKLVVDPLPADMKPYTETIPGTKLTIEMIPIPGGTYWIGSPESEKGRNKDEGPQRAVRVEPFWMSKYELIWDIYDTYSFALDIKRKKTEGVDLEKQPAAAKAADAVTRPTPPYADMTFGMGHDNQPAICMTHHSAMECTRWLGTLLGKAYRLPTEAEWEWAARGGTATAYSFGDDASKLGEYGWYVENAEKPQVVGKKKPNPFGLYDMHGNVAEWVMDHYEADAFAKLPADKVSENPFLMPDTKEYSYVAKGGSWDDDPEALRSAARRGSDKEWSVQDPQRPQSIWWHTDATFVGFRIMRAYKPKPGVDDIKSPIVKQKGTK